jgi:hypothetical protein
VVGVPELYAEANGLARQYARWPAVIPGEENDVGDIRLAVGFRATGRVTDDAGAPLPGVPVRVHIYRRSSNSSTGYGPPLTVHTDDQGRYQLPPLPLGTHRLEFFAAGRERGVETVDVHLRFSGQIPTQALPKDVPVTGTVTDDDGKPIEGAVVGSAWHRDVARTDRDGKFTIRGYGPNSSGTIELPVTKTGYTSDKVSARAREPVIKLTRLGGFAGRAIDAADGRPIAVWYAQLERVERGPDGKTTPRGRVEAVTAKSEPGRYLVYTPSSGDLRLRLRAEGYADSDWHDLPPLTARRVSEGPVVRLRKADPVARTRIEGTAARGGKPVSAGWAVAYRPYQHDSGNHLARGRLVPAFGFPDAQGPIRGGRFTLPVPDPTAECTVAVFEPNRPPTFLPPVKLTAGEVKKLAVVGEEPGSVVGSVPSWPVGWDGHLWAVAFTAGGYVAEVPVGADGRFRFPALPPGEYGLKVGHDGFRDADVPASPVAPPGDPWARAVKVRVSAGKTTEGIELRVPEK